MVIRRVPNDEFERSLEQMIAQGPVPSQMLFSLANIYVNQRKKLKEAEDLLRQALKKEPKNDKYLYTLGCARFYQKNYKKAEDAFRKAAALKADDYHSGHFIGLCRFHLGKKEEGIKINERVTRIDPRFVYAWRSLGMMYHEVGRQDDAEMAYMRAVALEPEDVETFATLKKIVEDTGREVVKVYNDGEGMLFINKRTKDGKTENQTVMTIPRKIPQRLGPWEVQSVTTLNPDDKQNPYTTFTGKNIPESEFDMPFGPVPIMCPKCSTIFIPTRKYVKPDGRILCHKCLHLFRNPLK